MYRYLSDLIPYNLYKWIPFKKKQDINAYVIDWDKREADWDKVDIAKIEGFSPLRRSKDKVFSLLLKTNNITTVINPKFSINSGEMPSFLYSALAPPGKYIEKSFGLKGSPWYKSKNLPYIVILCICLFLMFLFYFAGGQS